MTTYKIYFTNWDIKVIKSWLEDRAESGHWGDNIVMTRDSADLMNIFKQSNQGYYILSAPQVNQLIHDAEKCFAGKYGMFNPVGSIFEIATLFKLNKVVGQGETFLKNWELTEKEIQSWLDEYE